MNKPHALRRLIAIALAVGMAALTLGMASAQSDYPNRTVRIIVPYGPGGGVDINTRALAPYLQKYLGVNVVVENHSGSGGITGHTLGAFAKPDGYTLTMVSPGIDAAPLLVKGVTFTPYDYEYIGQVTFVPNFLIVSAKSQFQTLDDLVSYAKAHPDEVTTGMDNGWPSSNVANAVFQGAAGIKVREITGYEGGASRLAAILGGHLDYSFHNVNEVLPHYKAGDVRVLAAAALKRSPLMPDVPTFQEQGYDVTVGVWRTLAAPKGTPQAIIDKVNAALQKALADPQLKQDFDKAGLTVDYLSPSDTRDLVLKQYQQWGKLFQQMGIAVAAPHQ